MAVEVSKSDPNIRIVPRLSREPEGEDFSSKVGLPSCLVLCDRQAVILALYIHCTYYAYIVLA